MSKKNDSNNLAVDGGMPVRSNPMPPRRQFNKKVFNKVKKVFEQSWKTGVDFGFQGHFEEEYCRSFSVFQGGGYADAVCSGTVATYIALKALKLRRGKQVIVPPVTDPGTISAVIEAGFIPVVCDSDADTFNLSPNQLKQVINKNTSAVIVAHIGGIPADIRPIKKLCTQHHIKLIEDCSQAHGAIVDGKKVGCFGDAAVFSTMFSKTHSTGGSGGVVFTKNKAIYKEVRKTSDRGKPFNLTAAQSKNPQIFDGPALNFNSDEISCAIGSVTLSGLERVIQKRQRVFEKVDKFLKKNSSLNLLSPQEGSKASWFFMTVKFQREYFKVSKLRFAKALKAEGIDLNQDYKYLVSEWGWAAKYIHGSKKTPNASKLRNSTFNILFHENYDRLAIQDICRAITKVERYMAK